MRWLDLEKEFWSLSHYWHQIPGATVVKSQIMWSPTLFSLPPLSLAQFLSLCSLGFSGTLHRGAVGGWWLCRAVWGGGGGEGGKREEEEGRRRRREREEAERGDLRRWEAGSIQTAGDMTLRGNARAILSPLFLSQSGFLRKTSQLRNHSNVKAGHKERDKISLYELNSFGSWNCQKKR